MPTHKLLFTFAKCHTLLYLLCIYLHKIVEILYFRVTKIRQSISHHPDIPDVVVKQVFSLPPPDPTILISLMPETFPDFEFDKKSLSSRHSLSSALGVCIGEH